MIITIRQLSRLSAEMLASRAVFDCGQPALNQYLVQTALQHEKRNVTRTFCLLQGDGIAGFYSLTNAIVNVGELTADLIRHYRLPTHVLPVVRLARLGIDVRHQRQGLGRLLLVDALRKVIAVAESSGCVGLLVDAQDENARLFYTAFGFRAAPENPLLLFMPLPDIQELFREV